MDKFQMHKFSGGEYHLKLKADVEVNEHETVKLDFKQSKDPMILLQAVDILIHNGAKHVDLHLPYLPYSRQDRRTEKYSPDSLRLFLKVLSSHHGVRHIITHDVHSEAATAMCSKLVNISQKDFATAVWERLGKPIVLAPDKGAAAKIEDNLPKSAQIFFAKKHRDPASGKLSSPEIPDDLPEGAELLVVDDICDGGYTFIQLADALPGHKLNLALTHGIFSKGVTELSKRYSRIFVDGRSIPSGYTDVTQLLPEDY